MEENNNQRNTPGVKETNKEILPNVKQIKQKETYALPSRGLVYKPNEGIGDSITLRRMTTKEEKIRLRNSTNTEIMRDLLQACIINENVKAENLKLVDANFLLFKLRIISLLDDKYKISVRCPNCGAEFIHEINLNEVPVKYLSDDIKNKLEVHLPLSNQTVTLKMPSLKDIITSGDKLEEYFDQFPNADRASEITTMTQQLYIDLINNTEVLSEEKSIWYDNLDIVDYKKLSRAIADINDVYGFDENIKTKCPKCEKEVTHGLPITNELFNPSYEDV